MSISLPLVIDGVNKHMDDLIHSNLIAKTMHTPERLDILLRRHPTHIRLVQKGRRLLALGHL